MPNVPVASYRLLEQEGEHWVPWSTDLPVAAAFVQRFELAATLAAGGRVLVLGSGEGFGAAVLAGVAEHVTAADGNGDCILHARCNYRRDNLVFVHHQPHDYIGLVEGPFQLVVAFEWEAPAETAESVIERAPGVLSDDGILLICEAPLRGSNRSHGSNGIGTHSPAARSAPLGDTVTLLQRLSRRFAEVACWQTTGEQLVPITRPAAACPSSGRPAGAQMVFAASRRPFLERLGALVSGATVATGVVAGLIAGIPDAIEEPAPGLLTPAFGLDDCLAVFETMSARVVPITRAPGWTAPPERSPELGRFASLDETQLRRQVVAYDSAVATAVAETRAARLDAENVRSNLEIVQAQLDAAQRNAAAGVEAVRCETFAVAARLEAAHRETILTREEAARLRAQLAAIEASRVYRALRRMRRRLRQGAQALTSRRR